MSGGTDAKHWAQARHPLLRLRPAAAARRPRLHRAVPRRRRAGAHRRAGVRRAGLRPVPRPGLSGRRDDRGRRPGASPARSRPGMPSWVERFSRSSGPGGQGVNTTDSRVELSFDVRRSPSVPDHLGGSRSSSAAVSSTASSPWPRASSAASWPTGRLRASGSRSSCAEAAAAAAAHGAGRRGRPSDRRSAGSPRRSGGGRPSAAARDDSTERHADTLER